ncbi:GAF domain-containing protein [Sphingomonas sp. HF-S4]|uniref:GAF domain-containing protein n=1 Tax=Sphingomonas agrestis TaxID=3080540 RepID=A0ABU3YD83_9SPHN|nr:GAF domain-containing protein [Sphingomonas sp. HF-S4]MDV3459346.1 GAF domain-containing protein [Sphingomonas sp. HF-S4]
MTYSYDTDISAVQHVPSIEATLQQVCALTGMGFAAVARVTSERWIACQVLDRIEFGMKPGDELVLQTTICDEIRLSGRAVFIDHVGANPEWRTHHTPAMYGFESYISVPIILADGSFFGTLCALDPAEREKSLAAALPQLEAMAATIAVELDRLRAAA